jgi:hypothetical protein
VSETQVLPAKAVWAWPALAAIVGGVLLGSLDFVWIKFVPFPLGALGNSSAIWAVAAFAFSSFLRRGWLAGIVGAVVLLVVAVPSYYTAAVLLQGDEPAGIWSPLWTAFAVVAGLVFGTAGTLANRADRWQVAGLATPVAVLFAEAGLLAGRVGNPSYGTGHEELAEALIEICLGLLVVLLVRASWQRRALAVLLALPFAVVGFALFRGAGFA